MPCILVVGDDPAPLKAIRAEPRLSEARIGTALGEADVLHTLRTCPADVVITDARTPVSSDLVLLNELRLVRPGVRMISIAPATSQDDVVAALRGGVFACFSAPADPAELALMTWHAIQEEDWRHGIEVLSAKPDWLSLRVSCRLVNAERLVRFMTEHRSDLPDAEKSDVMAAFRELILNAIEHGAGFDPEKVVEVSAIRTSRTIVYYFRDPGRGFDAAALAHAARKDTDPLTHVAVRADQGQRPGGFGMLLASRLVDELLYSERGNEVILIKHTQ